MSVVEPGSKWDVTIHIGRKVLCALLNLLLWRDLWVIRRGDVVVEEVAEAVGGFLASGYGPASTAARLQAGEGRRVEWRGCLNGD